MESFLIPILSNCSGTLAQHIKYRVFKNLKPILPKWSENDVSILEYLLMFSPSDSDTKQVYDWLFEHESFKNLKESLTKYQVKWWCEQLIFDKSLPDENRKTMFVILKETDQNFYNNIMARIEIHGFDKTQLLEMWDYYCKKDIKEVKAIWHLNRKKGFLENVSKIGFENGFTEEFFEKLPQYLVNHDLFNCQKFMELMPMDTNEVILEKFKKILDENHLLWDEEDLIRKKINEFETRLVLEKAN